MTPRFRTFAVLLSLLSGTVNAQDRARPEPNFPPSESKGGWPTLLPDSGEPDDAAKAKILKATGVDYDKLKAAWDWNCKADGSTGLIVIRHGKVIGEWYRDCDKTTAFNIYSSSKT